MKLTNTQVVDLLLSERPWNIARRIFANHAAIISKVIEESDAETEDEIRSQNAALRVLEFEAVFEIARALGVQLSPATGHRLAAGERDASAPNPDPEGLRKWLGPAPDAAPGTSESGPREGPGEPGGPEVAGKPERCS